VTMNGSRGSMHLCIFLLAAMDGRNRPFKHGRLTAGKGGPGGFPPGKNLVLLISHIQKYYLGAVTLENVHQAAH
jgi:hypothetical protein